MALMQKDCAECATESAPKAVLMRLTRGWANPLTRILRSAPSTATVTVGADESSDWRVEAPGVPGHALSIALFDGGLFVASGPQAEVSWAGGRVPEVWQSLHENGSLEFGDACIELVLLMQDELPMSSERDRPTFPDALRPGGPESRAARASWVDGFSQSTLFETPSVFGRVAESRSGALVWRYAALALFTALAYRAWLILLDSI